MSNKYKTQYEPALNKSKFNSTLKFKKKLLRKKRKTCNFTENK